MTLAQTLTRFSPLTAGRPAARPAAAAPAPVEPLEVRDCGPSRLSMAAAAGLALLGTGLAMGAMSAPAMAQEVKLETAQHAVDRHAAPIGQGQWARMKEAGTVGPRDNASARQAKEGYLRAAEDLLPEGDVFQAQGQRLESTGRSLDKQAAQAGQGTHKVAAGTLTVTKDHIKLVTATSTQSLTRTGGTTVIEVVEDGFTTRLEDTSAHRSITEGGTTRTLHLRGSALHQAGEFQVQNWSENTTLAGTTIHRQTADNNETWELKPNLTWRSNAGQTQVKPDGSTVVTRNGQERTEAAQPNAPVTFTVFE